MSLLSYTELRNLQRRKVIENSLPEHVNSASIDITLGPHLLLEAARDTAQVLTGRLPIVSLKDRTPLHTVPWTLTEEKPAYTLEPGEFLLAQSAQVFNLPSTISCEYKMKSSGARSALNHSLAGWCDAGWHGSVLTLELKNISRYHAIRLELGDLIGQMIFFRHTAVPARASYAKRGRYNNDKKVHGVKL